MSEIKIGEYVRTNKGIIAKCSEEKQDRYIFDKVVIEEGYYNNYIFKDIPERANFITKHSPNIIDLIEEGDYVNGIKVTGKEGTLLYTEIKGIDRSGYHIPISQYGEGIERIVTKERFKESEYKVNE